MNEFPLRIGEKRALFFLPPSLCFFFSFFFFFSFSLSFYLYFFPEMSLYLGRITSSTERQISFLKMQQKQASCSVSTSQALPASFIQVRVEW